MPTASVGMAPMKNRFLETIWNPGSAIRNRGPGIWNLKSGIWMVSPCGWGVGGIGSKVGLKMRRRRDARDRGHQDQSVIMNQLPDRVPSTKDTTNPPRMLFFSTGRFLGPGHRVLTLETEF